MSSGMLCKIATRPSQAFLLRYPVLLPLRNLLFPTFRNLFTSVKIAASILFFGQMIELFVSRFRESHLSIDKPRNCLWQNGIFKCEISNIFLRFLLSMRRFFDSLMKESLLDIFNNITCEFTLLSRYSK